MILVVEHLAGHLGRREQGQLRDLAPDLLDRLRNLGVLYDRSKTGEFFHIYTATYEDRFFFEIVERRNYDLFGAANTPVRLAAQTRAQDLMRQARLQFDG